MEAQVVYHCEQLKGPSVGEEGIMKIRMQYEWISHTASSDYLETDIYIRTLQDPTTKENKIHIRRAMPVGTPRPPVIHHPQRNERSLMAKRPQLFVYAQAVLLDRRNSTTGHGCSGRVYCAPGHAEGSGDVSGGFLESAF